MNKVILTGRLTRDAEYTRIGKLNRDVIKFTLAVQKKNYSKDVEKKADFIPVVYWLNDGEKLSKYLIKGLLLGVAGSINTRSYTSSEGVKKYITEVAADSIQFLDSKKENMI